MTHEREFSWYLTFVSIVFGVLISVWVGPFVRLAGKVNWGSKFWEQDAINTFYQSFHDPKFLLLGFLMFVILVCLWWWYGIFLGQIAPAKGFFMYGVDFVTLGAFAIATGFWNNATIFPIAVIGATLLMLFRFCLVYWKLPEPSRVRWALRSVLLVLAFTAPTLITIAITKKGFINEVVMAFMLIGLCVTVVSVRITEGFLWGRTSPITQPVSNKLKLIVPKAPDGVESERSMLAMSVASMAKDEFEAELGTSDVLGWKEPHLSTVHTLSDVEVQAALLSVPSVEYVEEIKGKSLLAYFGHWLDDIFDRHRMDTIQKFISRENKTPEFADCFNRRRDRNVHNFAQSMCNRIGGDKGNKFMEVGLQRLMLGSLLFNQPEGIKNQVEQLHRNLLEKHLGDDELIRDFDSKFVDLTTKTVQELWFGLEQWRPPFRLTFLYSLLFAPALYYHDYKEEKQKGELSDVWQIGPKESIDLIEKVGALLLQEVDPRRVLRAWQINPDCPDGLLN
jgi:hypothetical protein|tara:strand:+ start:141 stop:1658 length:1518 start_codon:yes stop_codon:yes gene_type:complete